MRFEKASMRILRRGYQLASSGNAEADKLKNYHRYERHRLRGVFSHLMIKQ